MPKVQFRVTDSEYALLKERAGGDLSSWLRSLAGLPPARMGRPAKRVEVAYEEAKRTVDVLRASLPPRPEARKFSCPVSGCDFSALSEAARCPSHGRRVS